MMCESRQADWDEQKYEMHLSNIIYGWGGGGGEVDNSTDDGGSKIFFLHWFHFWFWLIGFECIDS